MNPAAEGTDAYAEDDPRLLRAVQEYHQELEAGRRPDRRAFATRFPDLAQAMAPYLDALDMMQTAAPLLDQSSRGSIPSPTGQPLGDFRIVREIGRGGMGIVYDAVQMSLGRRVALKVLPFAAALDAKQLQRFKNEAQAAAQLHHTNIVPVHYVGCERGVHFYAMQLIEGQNLEAIIGDLRRREAPERPSGVARPGAESTGPYASPPLPASVPAADTRPILKSQFSTQRSERAADFFRTAARLTAQAAEALEYAHGLGIVHRDVKPANLLIDDRGNVWLTDFGLAQFHADAGLTQTGALLGTLRYMSPEQAGGPRVLIDHRTDVYSLGATLYELLTLRPIFDGEDRQTLLQQILHQEPPAPRSVVRSIPPELETIVLKAVAKVPAERYATARDLAEDLHRFLRHEPIRARRATLAQRGRKWLRRHPSVLVAGAVLLVLLAAASLVSSWLVRGAYERERQRAEEAEQQFRLARRSVDELIQVSEEELADKPHMEGLRKRLLEAALAYYQEFIEQRRDDPDAQALAATQTHVRKILDDLAVLQGAGQYFLLNEQTVLEELELSNEKRGQITDLSRRLARRRDESFKGFHRLTPDERQRRFLELARANEKEVGEILTQQQLQRLRQIALQMRGPGIFREPDIAATLKLTAGQREQIRSIEAETFFGFWDPKCHGGPPAELRKNHEQRLKEASERIRAVLTEEQERKWKEMTGKPFTAQKPFFLPPPPPGGPFRPQR
jgi:serine/threonine protein kinase